MLTEYTLKMPHAVYGGAHAMDNITAILKTNKATHVALFTDKGIEATGLFALPEAAVKATGIPYTVLDDLPAEPSYLAVQAMVDQFKALNADFIVACGGGSVMDAAKLASVLVTDAYGVKELLDNPGFLDDPRFATRKGRVENMADMYREIARLTPRFTSAELLARCEASRLPAMIARDIADVPQDPHLNAVGFFRHSVHPTEGAWVQLKPPVSFSACETVGPAQPPLQGEHGAEIRREIGIGE